MIDYLSIIDKYYESGSALRQILTRHSRQVADLALELAYRAGSHLDPALIEAAAMLHDIGIVRTDAPGIECHGSEPYICHGTIGAAMLRAEGVCEEIARVAERHTGAGLSAVDIAEQHLPLPAVDLLPETELERLICYADKFYSKSGDMQFKSFDRVRRSLARHGSPTLARFDALAAEWGIPDPDRE